MHVGERGGPAAALVEIRLLGGFGVRVDGSAVPTGSWRLRKARDVVKLLALAPQHRRHRDEVVEALWPGRDTNSGLNNLHQALHIARRGLAGADGSARGRLRVKAEWVALCPGDDLRVDVEDFEAAADVADGSADPALLTAALALYPGDLLPEDRYEDWAMPRCAELRGRRRRLVTGLAALRAADGDPQAAVSLLGPLVADDPADEVAQRGLMSACALSGDRGSALRQYQALAAALRDTLGVRPDVQTEQLYQDILAGKLGARPVAVPRASGPATPDFPERGGSPDHRPGPARRAPPVGHNLPVRLSTFVGRDRALGELSHLLSRHRLVTLTGPGGSGKTRLALETAQRELPGFPGGAWLTELAAAPGTGDAAVGRAISRALSLRENSGESPVDAVAAHLAGQRALLVLDNCEHRIDGAARAVSDLLARCPELVVLATSQEPLRVPGETLWQLPPLGTPEPGQPPEPAELARHESVRLFTERAMAAAPGFALNEETAPAVAEICARLDGLPLAIELAAARVPALGVTGVADGLDDRFALLTGGSRTADHRQRTLAATFDWSYDLLTSAEQAAFRRLSVFADEFSRPAANAVVGFGPGDTAGDGDLAFVLPDLADRSMISIEHDPVTPRYRLTESLRAYGRARLAAAGEAQAAAGRHAAWYLAVAREAAGHYAHPGRRLWFEHLDADRADFQIALATLLESAPDQAVELAAALWPYWVLSGSFGEGLDALEAALAACPEPSAARVEALLGAFAIRLRWAGPGAENPAAVAALELARSLDDPLASARAAFFTGIQAWVGEDLPAAESAFRATAGTARAAGLTMAQASAVHALGCVAWSQGRPAVARRRLREALALARRDLAGAECGSFWQLTIAPIITGQWQGRPRLVFEESHASLQENLGMAAVAYIRASMGSLARSHGDPDVAHGLLEEALTLFEDEGDEAGVALAYARLGNLAAAGQLWARAREYLPRSLEIRRRLGDQRGVGLALMSLGRLESGAGQPRRAAELFTEAAASFRASGDRPAMMLAMTRLGELHIPAGAGAGAGPRGADGGREAIRILERATALLRVMGHGTHLGLGLAALAEAYAAAGRPAQAADTASEASKLVACAPPEDGREHMLRRLAEIVADADRPAAVGGG